ncbi:MAG: hypothetical protein EOO90_03870 [Pedobacter sp.]|nr:MAG: hypothetical protein EOO90_03870 [Pedobacter sp.]
MSKTIRLALDNKYPIEIETYQNEKFGNQIVNNFYQTINWLNLNLIIAEERILEAEVKMLKAEKFKPLLSNTNVDENFHIKSMEIIVNGLLKE